MKRIMMLMAVAVLMAAMLALAAMPAFAQDVHPLNHGGLVSPAAHHCPPGTAGPHCVYAIGGD
jgi:hypothetical protein